MVRQRRRWGEDHEAMPATDPGVGLRRWILSAFDAITTAVRRDDSD